MKFINEFPRLIRKEDEMNSLKNRMFLIASLVFLLDSSPNYASTQCGSDALIKFVPPSPTEQNIANEEMELFEQNLKGVSSRSGIRNILHDLPQYSTYRLYSMSARKSFLGKTLNFGKGLSLSIGDLLIPSYLNSRMGGEVSGIFYRQYRKGAIELFDDEISLLKKTGQYETFLARNKFIQTHPKWFKVRRLFRDIYDANTILLWGLAVNTAFQMEGEASSSSNRSVSKGLVLPPLKIDEIQLISETLPFPHMAVRIDDRVYSYGTERMTVSPVAFYLQNQLLTEYEIKKQNLKLTNWAKLRSPQVITLALTEIEKKKLKSYLVNQTDKVYWNRTFQNDCSSMVARALNQNTSIHIPQIIDPSPSLVVDYFAARKGIGDSKVRRVSLMKGWEDQTTFGQRLRNVFVNYAESRIYSASWIYNQISRSIMNSKGADKISNWDEIAKEEFSILMKNQEVILQNEPEIFYYESLAKKGKLDSSQKKMDEFYGYFKEQIDRYEKASNSEDGDYYDLLVSKYAASWLKLKRDEIIKIAEKTKNEVK